MTEAKKPEPPVTPDDLRMKMEEIRDAVTQVTRERGSLILLGALAAGVVIGVLGYVAGRRACGSPRYPGD